MRSGLLFVTLALSLAPSVITAEDATRSPKNHAA
jgi:hypothetical protein